MAAPDLASITFSLQLDGMDDAVVVRDVPFGAGAGLDLYRPAGASGALPAVVLVSGYADAGLAAYLGRKPRDTGIAQSWGRLVAASGMVGVVADSPDPNIALPELFGWLATSGREHGIDAQRVGLWAASGNGPNAVGVLVASARGGRPIRAAVVINGFLMDLDDAAEVANAAKSYRFANPTAGLAIGDLPQTPLLLVRSGADQTPGLNASLDRFVAAALAVNLPVTLVNQPRAPHALELFDPSAEARTTIAQAFAFLRDRLARLA